ncbi:4094_t:CDS:2 [Dentiscutata heterogama]|uniref:4094_t:CDS:1 n=1 Tax=Dentiscutata heterogama TaxID=1316150 RepID=A0ACA9KWQ1_9GLOM|nr:4094_t:CDS:2 [Dentiscutata heterogama]
MNKFYVVYVGKTLGIYMSWQECKEQISNNSVTRNKKFTDKKEVQLFMKSSGIRINFENIDVVVSERGLQNKKSSEIYAKLFIPSWKKNNWKNNIQNKNLFIRIDELFELRPGKIILTFQENCSKFVQDLALEGAEKEFVEHMEVDVETNSSLASSSHNLEAAMHQGLGLTRGEPGLKWPGSIR